MSYITCFEVNVSYSGVFINNVRGWTNKALFMDCRNGAHKTNNLKVWIKILLER